MNTYVGSIALTIAGNIGYHLLNKSVAPNAHPFASLVATYAIALAVSLVVLAVDDRGALLSGFRNLNWASYALGTVVVLLELGFLLAYRAGWKVSIAALYANVAVGMLLLPIGLLLYRETLTASNAAGVVLAVLSLLLMTR